MSAWTTMHRSSLYELSFSESLGYARLYAVDVGISMTAANTANNANDITYIHTRTNTFTHTTVTTSAIALLPLLA